MNIKVRDNRSFGRRPVVGVHCIKSLHPYRCLPLDQVDYGEDSGAFDYFFHLLLQGWLDQLTFEFLFLIINLKGYSEPSVNRKKNVNRRVSKKRKQWCCLGGGVVNKNLCKLAIVRRFKRWRFERYLSMSCFVRVCRNGFSFSLYLFKTNGIRVGLGRIISHSRKIGDVSLKTPPILTWLLLTRRSKVFRW